MLAQSHGNLTIITFVKKYLLLADWTFRNHLRDSDDEVHRVATEQLIAIVDVMFMPHNDPVIS